MSDVHTVYLYLYLYFERARKNVKLSSAAYALLFIVCMYVCMRHGEIWGSFVAIVDYKM